MRQHLLHFVVPFTPTFVFYCFLFVLWTGCLIFIFALVSPSVTPANKPFQRGMVASALAWSCQSNRRCIAAVRGRVIRCDFSPPIVCNLRRVEGTSRCVPAPASSVLVCTSTPFRAVPTPIAHCPRALPSLERVSVQTAASCTLPIES